MSIPALPALTCLDDALLRARRVLAERGRDRPTPRQIVRSDAVADWAEEHGLVLDEEAVRARLAVLAAGGCAEDGGMEEER